jgi:hypothetical protein
MEFLEQGIEFRLALGAVGFDHLQHGADVLLHRQAAEDRGLLRQIADAKPRPPVHRHVGDVVAVDLDGALIGPHQTGDHVEDGGLAGAVGAEKPDRLAARHGEAGVPHHHALAIGLGQALGDKPAAPAGIGHEAGRRRFRVIIAPLAPAVAVCGFFAPAAEMTACRHASEDLAIERPGIKPPAGGCRDLIARQIARRPAGRRCPE